MIASSGAALAKSEVKPALKARLLPLIDCLTPNVGEAAALLEEREAQDEAELARQGRSLLAFGPRAILMKGGHLPVPDAVDLLVTASGIGRFAGPRSTSRNLHGTGCALASAIAAYVALGRDLETAVGLAKAFVAAAIERGRTVTLGRGPGPLIQG
jgi:hydroxymethylpyrimidine/phosphomethylpyrimidine kinase